MREGHPETLKVRISTPVSDRPRSSKRRHSDEYFLKDEHFHPMLSYWTDDVGSPQVDPFEGIMLDSMDLVD